MTENEFKRFVCDRHLSTNQVLMESALGLCSEAGEVAQAARKVAFECCKQNDAELALELGDVLHYLTLLSTALGLDVDDLRELNRLKLRERMAGRERDMELWLGLSVNEKPIRVVLEDIRGMALMPWQR